MKAVIAFDCEQCRTTYKVDESRAGQTAKCRQCGAKLRVPVPLPPTEISPAGVTIMRRAERSKPFEPVSGNEEHIEAIADHVARYVGEATKVFHELVSDLIQVDVHHVPPGPDHDFHTLFTSGMSDRPMTVPDEVEEYQFAELLICLPADWTLTQTDFKHEKNYWPIRLLKSLARLPYEYDTWLGVGHTVPNGDPPEPYAPGTRFCCAMLVPPLRFDSQLAALKLADGRIINFYCIWPLLPEEVEFKLQHGFDDLIQRLRDRGVNEVIQLDRASGVRRRWWPWSH